jgi:hypothetical protein
MIIQPIHESNDCHNPAGPGGGRFCSDHGPRSGLAAYPRSKYSKPLPGYLKADVLRARRAGIDVHHAQQPEPVMDSLGNIVDPLAKSQAQGGESTIDDEVIGFTKAPRGRILITTRGGEFEPTYNDYSLGAFSPRRKTKDLTPADLTDPATPDDVTSTFRHEMGHILDRNFGRAGQTVPIELARELRAWVYAVEASPEHTVSQKMVRSGLESHAYSVFRKQEILKENPWLQRGYSFELDERLENVFKQELRDKKPLSDPAAAKAQAFTDRAMKALNKYGEVLRKKGIGVPEPPAPKPYIPENKLPTRGPGRSAFL